MPPSAPTAADAAPRLSTLDDLVSPVTGADTDFDPVQEMIGDRPVVLLGEATHGTHEFYEARARITRRLIAEKGFNAVAVEADWPDAHRVHRYVRGADGDQRAVDALGDFKRFPTWMWRNRVVLEFVDWLAGHNAARPLPARVGFYGLDLYSLYASAEAVVAYLRQADPDAAEEARRRYACFDHVGSDPQQYGLNVAMRVRPSCRDAVVHQLIELRRKAGELLRRDGLIAEEEHFFAEQNARVVESAEAYYRHMFGGRVNTWNLRDAHMADTLDHLIAHLRRQGRESKVVVWEHNSHLGDARATEAADRGEYNVGQLTRQRHGAADVAIVGFTTYDGTVTAASDWDGPAERKQVRPALPGSTEALFHQARHDDFMLRLDDPAAAEPFSDRRLQRMIGVVYRPQTERASHYFHCHLAQQYDAVLHYDHTRAVEPLERTPHWDTDEVPQTYPSGV